MLNWIIGWSLRHRFIVLLGTLAFVVWGVHSLSQLPIDAFPDTTPVQVQVNTVAPALSPEEVERQITQPVEVAISGLPRLSGVRSVSKFGLSQVTVTFEDGTDIYFARQLINERLGTVELPGGIERPEMGPVATGLGEVFHYLVVGKGDTPASLTDLTTAQDWIIAPQLRQVRGVAEVNTWGGLVKQFEVIVEPSRLIKYGLTLDEVSEALAKNNASVGGGQVTRGGESMLVHGVALTSTVEQIANAVIKAEDGTPIRVRDVAEVREGHEIRRGAVTAGGKGEAVLGLGFMLMGENSHEVTKRLDQRLQEVRASLPSNVDVQVVYRRTDLVDHVIHTVQENLLLGALFVIAVLFAFLGNLRAGLIVALAIPLAMLFSFSLMMQFGIAASLLSLGAIDFGLVVDSSVIIVENSVRRIGHDNEHGGKTPILDIVRDAAVEVRKPTMFGELIIMIVFLPILLLEGVEGKLFRPMALTVVFALLSSLIFSLTLTPVLCSLVLSRRIKERENWLVRGVQWVYRPFVHGALRFRWLTVAFGIAIVAGGAVLATRLGTAFIPRLYEEAVVVNIVRLAGVSIDQSADYNTRIEKYLADGFPDEIDHIWTRFGTAAVATDPMGIEQNDVFITLKPRKGWTKARTQADLSERISESLQVLPGVKSIMMQPIEMRMNEMIAGIRADVGILVFGDDLEQLRGLAGQVQGIVESIPGAGDVSAEQVTGAPVLQIRVDQDAIARYGIPAQEVLEIVQALGEIKVGQVRDGQRRFDLTLELPDRYRADPDAIGEILVPTAAGERIPLARLARISPTEGPTVVNRDWGKRRVIVQTNVRGRDLGGFVAEARERIAQDVKMPPGYYATFGGQFEHYERATRRLYVIVPIVLASIALLLYFSVGSWRDAAIVLTGAPFAALGGVLALMFRGLDFTISAAVGFIAVSGVSMLSGLVLVSTIRQRIARGAPINEAIEQTRLIRLRPILMTALVAALGFVPMALNTGVGAEVQRPLATVVIAGIITDNLLTLFVLPALYSLWGGRDVRARASLANQGSGSAVGPTPTRESPDQPSTPDRRVPNATPAESVVGGV
ncbi:MAG: efflux RND transporter permease subunit [Phycisphaerae bacterium]|nr:efflux RND transporter permease subunit [Phycisphaerae bacterium]